jgi:hypothetical protein
MRRHPAVLLVDDGELDDVSALVRELGTEGLRLLGGAEQAGWREPRRLLVVAARRALALPPPAGERQAGCTRVAVLPRASAGLAAQLRARGFDRILTRPVHPEALRLLVQGALAGAREQRAEPRLPVGLPVRWRAGLRPRAAILAELSTRGCSLVVYGRPVRCGGRVRLRLPAEIAGTGAPLLRARPVRFQRRREDLYTIALVFEAAPAGARRALERALAALRPGLPLAAARAGRQDTRLRPTRPRPPGPRAARPRRRRGGRTPRPRWRRTSPRSVRGCGR